MKFIGREKEQRRIDCLLDAPGYQGCIVYGRRRLGKTSLVKHCVERRECRKIIFQCSESGEKANAEAFSRVLQKEYGLAHLSFTDFMGALEFVFSSSLKEETILVIDEYPYLREIIEGCDSRLQELIDRYQADCRLKLFLLGSSIATMEELFSYSCPLFQRFQCSLLLKQMDYYESSLFYESLSNEEKVQLYSVFGGVPFYNAQIVASQGVKDNIIRVLSGHFSGLKDFIEADLKAELRKINNANAVFEAIAMGAFHHKEILDKSHLDSSSLLSAVLEKLVKMDLVEKISPINEMGSKQKSGYVISDPAVRFYYHFLARHASSYECLDDEAFYDAYIREEMRASYVPHAFEKVVREYLIRHNGAPGPIPLLTAIGKYWYDNPKERKNGEFDVVGRCEGGYIFFECKYTDAPMDDQAIEKEVGQVNQTTLQASQYAFVSKSGFCLKRDYPYVFLTLDDIYR